jgi:hypothetical protein
MSRCFKLVENWTRLIDVLSRKAMLPPPEDQAGTFVCPYCYVDMPHSPKSHDLIADAIDEALRDGIVLSAPQRNFLRLISSQCREHGEAGEGSAPK